MRCNALNSHPLINLLVYLFPLSLSILRYSTYHPCILLDYLPGTFLAQPLFDLYCVAGQARPIAVP